MDRMLCADIVKIRGGKYHDLILECGRKQFKPWHYEVIFILAGFNLGKHLNIAECEESFSILGDFLKAVPRDTLLL